MSSFTIGDWDKTVDAQSSEDLAEQKRALQRLSKWATFKEQFAWTNIFILIDIIDAEQKRRTQPVPAQTRIK